jgi:hypothetical protein
VALRLRSKVPRSAGDLAIMNFTTFSSQVTPATVKRAAKFEYEYQSSEFAATSAAWCSAPADIAAYLPLEGRSRPPRRK